MEQRGKRMKEFSPTAVRIADGTRVTIWNEIVIVARGDVAGADSHLVEPPVSGHAAVLQRSNQHHVAFIKTADEERTGV